MFEALIQEDYVFNNVFSEEYTIYHLSHNKIIITKTSFEKIFEQISHMKTSSSLEDYVNMLIQILSYSTIDNSLKIIK